MMMIRNQILEFDLNLIGSGQLELLKWLRRNDCPWNESTCSEAAGGGQIELLKWARENGCPWNESVCSSAAQLDHL